MFKVFFTSLFMLMVAAPALAKSSDVYPVSCNDLWAAVKSTLDNPRDYAVIWMDDNWHNASFSVIGNLTVYVDKVALTAKESGCAMKETFSQVGADNSDWRQFHHRLVKALAKQQATKPKPETSAADGQL